MKPDFKKGAIEYVEKLPKEFAEQLHSKPFGAGPMARVDCAQVFHDFANLITILRLDSPRRILDVGCGPGWLSEYLSRLGHQVTGVDICPDMVEIARQRMSTVRPLPGGIRPRAEFQAQDIENLQLDRKFHIAILYDTFHHFEDRPRVLQRVFEHLEEGGRIFVHEGVKPPEGSAEERHLKDIQEKFDTLEDPVSQEELLKLLEITGFEQIETCHVFNGIFTSEKQAKSTVKEHFRRPNAMNIVLARRPRAAMPTSDDPSILRAKIEVLYGADTLRPQEMDIIGVRVENTGDTLWLSRQEECGGFVALAAKILDDRDQPVDETIEWCPLPEDIAPGDFADIMVKFSAPAQEGSYRIRLDLVDVSIAWFGDRGSPVVDHSFEIRNENP